MTDSRKTKAQLIAELQALRKRLAAAEGNAGSEPGPASAPGHGATISEGDRRFLDLVEGSLQGVVVHRDFQVLFASQALARMFGYESGEAMMGMELSAIIHPDEMENQREYFAELMANRLEPRIFEGRGIRKDGSMIEAQLFATVVDWDGAPAAQVAVQDITVRKRAEQSLREYQRLLETVFDAIPLKIFVKDREGRYITVNQQTLDESGLTLAAFRGRRAKDIAYGTEAERAQFEAADRRVLETGEALDLPDRTFTDRHGKLHLQHVRKIPLRNDEGEVSGLVGVSEDITERKRSEEKLRTSESRMRLLTDAVPVMIAYVDAQQRYRFTSRSLQQWMDSDVEDILGKHLSEVISPESYAITKPCIEQVLRGEKVDYEAVLPYPDGKTRRIHAIYIPDIGAEGEIRGFSAMVEDITEQRNAEQELSASRQMLQAVFDAIPSRITVRDRNNRLTMVNRAHVKGLDISPEEFVNLPEQFPLLRKEDIEKAERFNRIVLEEGRTLTEEGPYQWSSGEEGIYHTSRVPLRNAQGDIFGLVVIHQDITGLKQAEEKLRTSQELFRAVFDTIPIRIVVRDRNDRISMANKAHVAAFGISTDEIAESPDAYLFVDPAQKEEVRALNRRVLETGQPLEMEWKRLWRDGRETFNREYRVPIKDAQGGVSGMVVVSEDITQRKNLEEQLLRVQKLEAVGELAGGVAHEFNNLLQIISASVEIALNKIPEEDASHRLLQSVQKAAERGALLVKQLLGFGRRQIMQATNLDINEQISSMVHLITTTMGERIQTIFKPGRGLNPVIADVGTFEQMIVNLCMNARDAMPGGGSLTVETANVELDGAFAEAHPWARAGSFVRVTVGDTGEGMTPEVLERIFEPFYSTKGPQQGSGLGLSMVYGAIQQHSGLIDVASEPGVGTSFNLYLPSAGSKPSPERKQPESPALSSGNSRGTVLIAEDEEQLQALTAQILESKGFETICAANGEEAVKLFESQRDRIKLVLLDLVMPKMGGGEAYDRIRLIRPDIPVIFQTGHDPDPTKLDQWAKQGLPVLRKPYSMHELLATIDELLAKNAQAAG